MPIEILMPALSPTMTEGTISKWLKKEGEEVSAGDVIAEIETDKATMEVEAIDDGILARIVVSAGTESVPVNQLIGLLLENGEDPSVLHTELEESKELFNKREILEGKASSDSSTVREVKASPLARRTAALTGIDISKVKGNGPHGKIMTNDITSHSSHEAHEPVSPSEYSLASRGSGDRIFVTPLARRLARELDLDLSSIMGTGPNHRIIARDIEQFQSKSISGARSVGGLGASELLRMSAMRKVIAERMVSSKSNVPHFYLTVDCELDELLKMRSVMNDRLVKQNLKLSVNDFVIKACGLALMDVPEANASFVGDGNIRSFEGADISVAVALDGGLITPIIRNAELKSLAEISAEMKILATKARDGKLSPEEYQGGSFSISNLGMFGIKQFDAIINEPQGAILAVGAGEKRPVVKDDKLTVATVTTCTLSCDHRVVDGAVGAMLIQAIKKYLEYPPLLLMAEH
jgi:pyruvate dehydrogenase E2 component (dihydrolipoamide acetyltransferase)